MDKRGIRGTLREQLEQQLDEGRNLFQTNLSTGDLATLFTRELRHPQGTILFNQGDDPEGAYLIKEGRIDIYIRGGEREVLLATLGENDIFGEMGLIDGETRSASARLVSDAVLGFLPREAFDRIIHEQSTLGIRLMSSICLGLIGHVQRLDKLYLEIKAYMSQQ
jgi:CRP-like cAMP-binding protein